MKVQPADQALGAIITGLDLTRELEADEVAQIMDAWAQYQVLIFPDQPLDHDALERVTQYFGPFGDDPFIEAMPERPHILELRREPEERSSNFGAAWHSDWSFQKTPPSATLLHAKIVPPSGGDTLFANSYTAFETLPPDLKKRIAGRKAIHSARGPYSKQGFYANERADRAMKILASDEALKTQTHPIVRSHPLSGRKSLFVNSVYTLGIDGLSEEDSAQILAQLNAHSVQPEFIYRHKWQPNMLVVWDNRCVQHCAQGGYDGHLRVMHRTTVQGEVPLG